MDAAKLPVSKTDDHPHLVCVLQAGKVPLIASAHVTVRLCRLNLIGRVTFIAN